MLLDSESQHDLFSVLRGRLTLSLGTTSHLSAHAL